MPKKTFDQASREFNENFQVQISIDEIERVKNKYTGLNSIFLNKKDRKTPRAQFVKLLGETLAIYWNAHTKMRASGAYDLTQKSLAEFIHQFDAMMQVRYEDRLPEGQEPTRRAYEGIHFEKLLGSVAQYAQRYNKTLPTIWAKNVLDKVTSIESVKENTSNAYDYLTKEVKFEGSAESVTGPVEIDKLMNVVGALQAMEKVHASRSWLWKVIINRSANKAEKAYIETLKSQVNELSKLGYPMTTISEKLSTNVLGETIEKANDEVQNRQQYRERKAKNDIKNREQEQAKQEKQVLMVSEKLNAPLEEEGFQFKFSQKLGGVLPEGGFGAAKTGMLITSMNGLVNTLKDTNEFYDRKIKEGATEQEAMQYYAKQVFYKTFEMTDMLGYYQLKDRVLAAQNMTDLIMKDLSPVSMAKDSLAMYAEGYILKNPELIMEGLAQDSGLPQESLEKAFDGAKKEYDRMPIHINEANNVMDMGKAPQVHQAPQIGARTMKN
jgi:hypothetical protein